MTKGSLQQIESYAIHIDKIDLEILESLEKRKEADEKFLTKLRKSVNRCLLEEPDNDANVLISWLFEKFQAVFAELATEYDTQKKLTLKQNEALKRNCKLQIEIDELNGEIEKLKFQPYN